MPDKKTYRIAYLCDMKACKECSGERLGLCFHTFDETHAKYVNRESHLFELIGDILYEKEPSLGTKGE